jgi:hypothetical protein
VNDAKGYKMRKTTFLIGTILVALNMQPLHAGELEERRLFCQYKWGPKHEFAMEFYHNEIDWINKESLKPKDYEELKERIARKNYLWDTLIPRLGWVLNDCIKYGDKRASRDNQSVIQEYNEFFGLSEDE